ncbi:hypothetical protein VPHD51_0092 [Vibrio phage D51]
MKKVIYEVLYSYDAYIGRSWFENECFAEKHSEERDGKEHIVNSYVVTHDFIKDNRIRFSDSEHYTESEWEQIEAHEEEYKLDAVIDRGLGV